MAKEQTPTEVDEKQYMFDVNTAVANTEMDIANSVFDEEEPDNDGDTSLEDTNEDIAGEDIDDEAEEAPDEEEPPREPHEDDEEPPEEEEDEDTGEDTPVEEEAQQQPEEDIRPRGIPSSRLREEADARRRAEQDAADLRRQLAEMNGRLTEISARQNAPPPRPEAPPPPRPDLFADPEGYERWIRAEARRDAQTDMDARMAQMEQRLQQQEAQRTIDRVNYSFEQVASGNQADKFDLAYGRLAVLVGNNDPNAPTIRQRIFASPDPGAALLHWWETTEQGQRYNARNAPRGARPRHETQLPETLRRNYPPSLNAQGGSRSPVQDPEMYDDTDDSAFRYATRR